MKKSVWKRLGLGLLQHLLAACIMLAVAGILLNSYIPVETIDGTQVYRIFPIDAGQAFEESEIYHELFRNAVSDITQLVMVRAQLETDDVFDPLKRIDVTEYARQIGADQGCAVSAVYELDDLIKWGKYGVEYSSRMMSMSEFVNYFGNCIYPENFTLDEYGQLCFDDFYRVEDEDGGEGRTAADEDAEGRSAGAGSGGNAGGGSTGTGSGGNAGGGNTGTGSGGNAGGGSTGTGSGSSGNAGGGSAGAGRGKEDGGIPGENRSGKSAEEIAAVSEKFNEYTQDQLEDLVLAHIMAKDLGDVRMSREDDGILTVSVPMLTCHYNTVDGKRQLLNYADNWVDYIRLQNNAAEAVKSLTENYRRYQLRNDAYREGRSNVKYMVRMMTDDGMCTYTNVSQIKDYEDNDVTEYFSEYRRYLIYYPDSLVFMGNTILGEEEIDGYLNLYDYAYPDSMHIWLCVDTNYTVEEDAFYQANAVYQRIVPNAGRLIGLLVMLAALWLGLGIYLTVTAGMAVGKNGEKIWYLNRFDRLWTEIIVLLGGAYVYGGVLGYRLIMEVAGTGGVLPIEMLGIQLSRLYHYGTFAVYGVYLSIGFNLIWYSLVRRMKADHLWEGSFLHYICETVNSAVLYILRHKNSAVSMLLPYNIFLFSNLAGIVAVYRLQDQRRMLMVLILAVMVVLDVVIGMVMFRRNAERNVIEEGIRRIRDGEVEYKIDTSSLHGSGKELADAVNNIGEGIRKAVRTSMKDEQMKTDLITNVSHDLKTPLTSIINYVDLLKRLKIEEEPAKGYIAILDGKAQRLKQLTDDLVEVSKISSGNIVLNREKLNLTELINQSIGEFSERLEECSLQVVFEDRDLQAYIYADSFRMWRVVENLFNNICKYALEGTRVYIDMSRRDGRIEASVKNISRQQMNIRPDELTERFIRGDSSRTTEGSGLGLSIAKSLVQAQGGSFEIFLDGDLFKSILSFPEYSAGEDQDLPEAEE